MSMTGEKAREKVIEYAGGRRLFFIIVTLTVDVQDERDEIFMYEKYITANPRAKIHCNKPGLELHDLDVEQITTEDAIVLIKTGAASLAPGKGEWLEIYSMEDIPSEPDEITGRVSFMRAK